MTPPFHNCGIGHVPVTGQLYSCLRKLVHRPTISNLRLMIPIIPPEYRDSPNPQTSSVVRSDGMKIPWFDSREADAIVQIDLQVRLAYVLILTRELTVFRRRIKRRTESASNISMFVTHSTHLGSSKSSKPTKESEPRDLMKVRDLTEVNQSTASSEGHTVQVFASAHQRTSGFELL